MAGSTSSWTRRLFEGSGVGIIRGGVALASVLILAFLLQEAILGRLSSERLGDIWVAVVHILIAAYLVAACAYCEQSRDRTVESLRPLLDETLAEPLLDTARRDRLILAGAGMVGIAFAVLSTLYVSPGPATYDPQDWSPESGWHRVLAPVLGFWATRLSVLLILEAGRLSDLARTIREIDLLDPAPLAPFARQGLTSALLAIGIVSGFALFMVDDVAYASLVVMLLVTALTVGGLSLLLPLRGVRDRVREAKTKELAWCRERLAIAREGLADDSNRDRGRLEELLAWETRIEAVSEWTLDASTFTRFALYLLIPLGSWAGGALVERVVDALLD